MFFQRNAHLGREHGKCRFNDDCEININTRHVCLHCRLKKCFASGMQMSHYRSSRGNQTKTSGKRKMASTISHERQLAIQLPTINLLRSDNSSLNSAQWILISNLIHSYDESRLLAAARRLMSENNISQAAQISDPILTRDFLTQTYETTGKYLRANHDFLLLSPDDRSVLLRHAAENVQCLSTIFVWNQSKLYAHRSFMKTCNYLYGEQLVNMVRHAMKFIDPDLVLIKIAASLFAFSNSLLILRPNYTMNSSSISTIFRIQSTYAEVTWKYLVYRYGYYQAVLRFNNLIQCLMAVTNITSKLLNAHVHTDDMESLVEQTEISLVLKDLKRMNFGRCLIVLLEIFMQIKTKVHMRTFFC
ncbi:unnamed protein product [Rotaria magnacalcarata]|uniref:Nuclear receptor domain-containing protein n=2 Tax=Rotaria magnacalcarata TaxID=392030 RepID=A0A815GVY9_9BILA|nr:unnamed protein product [Rotaria magnacalcarata]